MRNVGVGVVAVLLTVHASAHAAVIRFDTDPFAGSTALTDPGRDIVGGEPTIFFDPATDIFEFSQSAFGPYGFTGPIDFVNATVAGLPTGGVNVIVLEEFGPPMAAGIAATLIANQITTPGAGVFVYFNTGLNLPRLVFSTDLDDPDADLKILARMSNLTGNQAALQDFTAANFAVPEPSSILLMTIGTLWFARRARHRR
jgi:hypothetical protein